MCRRVASSIIYIYASPDVGRFRFCISTASCLNLPRGHPWSLSKAAIQIGFNVFASARAKLDSLERTLLIVVWITSNCD